MQFVCALTHTHAHTHAQEFTESRDVYMGFQCKVKKNTRKRIQDKHDDSDGRKEQHDLIISDN